MIPDEKSEPEPIDLATRFPKMKPLKSAPALFTINGFGVGLYGRRASDPETGTYITTRCICAVFIPVLPVDAYRVADTGQGGWYFLGKEALSPLAKFLRRSVLGAALVLIGNLVWLNHTNSSEYKAEKATKHAQELAAQGHALDAANVYQDMIVDNIGSPVVASMAISKLIREEITSGDAARCAAALRYIESGRMKRQLHGVKLSELADLALAAAAKCANPADAESILSAFTPAPTEISRVHQARKDVLEKLYIAQPDSTEVRINLALIREEFGEVDGALNLLEPAAAKLGAGEGARLYGHLLLQAGREAEALPHLEHYVTPKAAALKTTETNIERVYEKARDKALKQLNTSGGPPGFMTRYQAADENTQAQMVDSYLTEQVGKNKDFIKARERYQQSSAIVPTIIELGVAYLRVSQAETDSSKRAEMLKKSENAFLSMKNTAGGTDEYRYFLAQVYFWSGRSDEGRKLFDELLESNKRNTTTLASVAEVYRELGEENAARKLLDEAFEKAQNDEQKSSIVRTRSLLARSADEKIEWLTKGPKNDPNLAINLAQARAEKAEQAGNFKEAARYYRESLAGYDKQERSSAVLNNSAILYGALYRVEGKEEYFENAARLFSDAVEMQPANSILSYNSASMLLSAAVLRVAKDRIDPKLLQYELDLDVLRFLYRTESEKHELASQLAADPNFSKALSRFWEALVLAPKNTDCYAWGAKLFHFIDDKESLQRLQQKAAEQEFDFVDQVNEYAKYVNHERDAELRDSLKGSRQRVASLVESMTDPKARAMAQVYAAGARLGGFRLDEATGAEASLADLKAARTEVPCSQLQSALESSLEIIALEKLAKEDPECLEIIKADRRHLDAGDVLRLLVRAKGALGDRVRKHTAVIEAREAAVETNRCFPKNSSLRNWLLLDGLRPEFGASFGALVKDDQIERLAYLIQSEIQFESPSRLINEFWLKCLDGDEAGARELQAKLVKAGIKMPEMF